MKEEHTASRTLVKSAPELWAECSIPASLTRHLGQFGEIKITKLEPETAVAWEGERASGTVRLEPSGWGTQVTLTATANKVEEVVEVLRDEVEEVAEELKDEAEEVVEEPEPEAVEPEPEPDPEPRAAESEPLAVRSQPKGLFARLRGLLGARSGGARPGGARSGRARSGGAGSGGAADRQSPPVPQPLGPEVEPETELRPEPVVRQGTAPAPAPADPETVLIAALDSLGQAHHRPFSRA